jgi:hypothetical protein
MITRAVMAWPPADLLSGGGQHGLDAHRLRRANQLIGALHEV